MVIVSLFFGCPLCTEIMQSYGSLISTIIFTFIDAMENKKLPDSLKECKAGMSNLINF